MTAAVAWLAVALLAGTWVALALVVRRDGWPSPAAPAAPPPPLRLTPAGRVVVLAAVVLVPVVGLAVINSTSGFVWDDIKNFRQAQVDGLSLSYVLEPTSGHFAPGHRLGDWIAQRAFGLNFAPAQALLLLGFAMSLVLFHRITVELFQAETGTERPRRAGDGAAFLLTLAYGVSMAHVGVTQWWASGLDRVPATVLSFVAILAYVRWHRTRAWPYLAVSVVAVPLGLLFYVKPVFVPVYLVLLRLLLLEPERPLGESLVATLREWRVWVLYAVTTGAVFAVYLSRYPTELNQETSLSVVFRYLGILWSQVFVPNLFGLFVPKSDVSGPIWFAAIAAHLLLVALVVWSVARWRWAWRAWAFFAGGFLLNALVVAATRVGYFSAKIIAYTTYFNLEAVFLFFLAVGAAFLGRRSSIDRPQPALSLPAARAGLGVGVAAYVALSLWGGYQIGEPENWIGARSRTILDRTDQGLSRLQRSGERVALVDGVVPDDVVPYLLVPYNSTSEVVPLFDLDVTFDPSEGELFHIARDGRVRPVSFVPGSGGTADRLVRTPDFGVVGATPQFLDGDRICVTSGPDTVTIGFQPPQPVMGDDLALSLEFGSRRASVMSLVVDPVPVITEGLAQGRNKFRVVNIQGGERQRRIFALDAPRANRVLVVIAPETEFCLYRLEVGHLARR